MFMERQKTLPLKKVLSSFTLAKRAATARPTSRRENPHLDSRSQPCSHTTVLVSRAMHIAPAHNPLRALKSDLKKHDEKTTRENSLLDDKR